MELVGKVAIVTGAGGGGSGRAEALRFAREGASVVVSDIDEVGGRETLRRIEAAGGHAAFCRADASVEADHHTLIAFAEKTYGGLDVLVNNAGPVFHEPLGQWAETVQVNLLGTMYAILHALPVMRRRGGGAIVNVSSASALGHGRKPSPWPAYDVAKAAVLRLTTTLGWLGEKENIRVNCLVPAWVGSDEVKTAWEAMSAEERKSWNAPNTLITLDQLTDAVVRLVTDEKLAGRVMVYFNDQPPRLIPVGDPGYAALEDLPK